MVAENPARDWAGDLAASFEARQGRLRARLRLALPLLAVALVLLALIGIALYSDRSNRSGALALSDDVIANLRDRVAREVDAYLQPAVSAVETARDLAGDNGALHARDMRRYGVAVLGALPQLAAIYAADPAGNFVMVQRQGDTITYKRITVTNGIRATTLATLDAGGGEHDAHPDPTDTYDARTRPWFTAALATDAPVWTGLYIFFTDKAPGVTAAVRAKGPDGTTIYGADIRLASLSTFLAGLKIGQTGRAVIVDRNGELVAAADTQHMMRDTEAGPVPARIDDLSDKLLVAAWDRYRVEGPGKWTLDIGGRRQIAVVSPLPGQGRNWLLVIGVPEDEFIGFVSRNAGAALAMSLVVVALAGVLAGFLVVQGMRADRAARHLAERRDAMVRQSQAFARLATAVAELAPGAPFPPAITETLAEAARARRAAVWRLGPAGLSCEDMFETARGHAAGLAMAAAELPGLVTAIRRGEAVTVADAATDRRTAAFHRAVMRDAGTRAVTFQPVGESAVISLEDAGLDAADLLRTAAAMLAARLAPLPPPSAHAATAAVAEPVLSHGSDMTHGGVSGWALPPIDPAAVAADVFAEAVVMAVQLSDPRGMAARAAGEAPVADRLARLLQDVARAQGLPYLKIMGHGAVAAAGLAAGDTGAAARIADAAIALRDAWTELLEDADLPLSFRIGIALGLALGAPVGNDPAEFNLWGEAVLAAEAMAATAAPGTIQVSEAGAAPLRHAFLLRPRGSFYVAGSGASATFILAGRP